MTFLDTLLNKCSSWHKLKRIVRWILRYKNIFKSKIGCNVSLKVAPHALLPVLSVNELEAAEMIIVEHEQWKYYNNEMSCLLKAGISRYPWLKEQEISRKSSLIKLQSWLWLADGIMRVGGRLEKAPIDFNAKHPIIIPHNRVPLQP